MISRGGNHLFKCESLDQQDKHADYISVTPQEGVFWEQDASGMLNSMQIGKGSQIAKEQTFLRVQVGF